MEMINEIEPIPIHADRVSCKSEGACMDRYGERMGLGAPNTYYQLNSTTKDAPVKCKYCGLRFYGVHWASGDECVRGMSEGEGGVALWEDGAGG